MYVFLAAVILLGMWNTIAGSILAFGGEYDYREGVSIWFRDLPRLRAAPRPDGRRAARVPAARTGRVRPLRAVALHPARARLLALRSGTSPAPTSSTGRETPSSAHGRVDVVGSAWAHDPCTRATFAKSPLDTAGARGDFHASTARLGQLVRGTRSEALWMATFGFFGGFAGVSIFGPLVPKFTDLLDLSPFAAGILAAIPALTGSLLRIPFGAAVDRVGGSAPSSPCSRSPTSVSSPSSSLLATRYPDQMDGTYPLLLAHRRPHRVRHRVVLGRHRPSVLLVPGQGARAAPSAPTRAWATRAPGCRRCSSRSRSGSLGVLGAYSIWFAILLLITIAYAIFVKDAPWFQLRRQGIDLPARGVAPARWRRAPAQRIRRRGAQARGRDPRHLGPRLLLLPLLRRVPRLHLLAADLLARDVRLDPAGGRAAHRCLLAALGTHPGPRWSAVGPDLDQVRPTRELSADARRDPRPVLLADRSGCRWSPRSRSALGMGLQNAIVFKLLPRYVPGCRRRRLGVDRGPGRTRRFRHPPGDRGRHRRRRRSHRLRPRVPARRGSCPDRSSRSWPGCSGGPPDPRTAPGPETDSSDQPPGVPRRARRPRRRPHAETSRRAAHGVGRGSACRGRCFPSSSRCDQGQGVDPLCNWSGFRWFPARTLRPGERGLFTVRSRVPTE